jgi:hypothetical protein
MSALESRSLTSLFSRKLHSVAGIAALCLVILGSALHTGAQDQDEGSGVSAGGQWTKYSSEDRMTAAHRVRLELPAQDAQESDAQARIILYCTNGKLKLADFRPNLKLSRPNWMGWSGPQMHVTVRADDAHSEHNWNWVNGHFLTMDKGTTRELIGAHLFRIEFQTPDGPRIAEFSPGGLDRDLVSRSCDLKPKKP